MENIFDILIMVCGGYIIYSAVKMKNTGSLEGNVLANKEINLKQAKDVPGFIRYMFLKAVILGIIGIISGGIGIYNTQVGGIDILQYIFMAIFLVALILYGVLSSKAAKRFL